MIYLIAQNLVVPPASGFGLCKNTTGVVNETFIDFHTMLRAWYIWRCKCFGSCNQRRPSWPFEKKHLKLVHFHPEQFWVTNWKPWYSKGSEPLNYYQVKKMPFFILLAWKSQNYFNPNRAIPTATEMHSLALKTLAFNSDIKNVLMRKSCSFSRVDFNQDRKEV